MARFTVRKTWSKLFPWEAWCDSCREHTTHLTPYGAVACNTRGVGNRLWVLAMLAGYAHLKEKHSVPPLPLHRTEAGYPHCSTCDGGGCPDCTDPA